MWGRAGARRALRERERGVRPGHAAADVPAGVGRGRRVQCAGGCRGPRLRRGHPGGRAARGRQRGRRAGRPRPRGRAAGVAVDRGARAAGRTPHVACPRMRLDLRMQSRRVQSRHAREGKHCGRRAWLWHAPLQSDSCVAQQGQARGLQAMQEWQGKHAASAAAARRWTGCGRRPRARPPSARLPPRSCARCRRPPPSWPRARRRSSRCPGRACGLTLCPCALILCACAWVGPVA